MRKLTWMTSGALLLWALASTAAALAQPPGFSATATAGHYGQQITVGSDGAMWMLGPSRSAINGSVYMVRVPIGSGRVRVYHLPGDPDGVVAGLAAGQDGALWYGANYFSDATAAILSTTTAGRTRRFATGFGGGLAQVGGLVAGPGDTLWYTGASTRGDYVSKITLRGKVRREVFSREVFGRDLSLAGPLTFGPGGLFWLSAGFRVSTTGKARRLPYEGGAIVAGADGNLWLGLYGAVGRLSTTGELTRFSLPPSPNPMGADSVLALAPGPDGNIWFVKSFQGRDSTVNDSVGKIDPHGHMTLYALPQGSDPQAIVAGPDGRMWIPTNGGPARIFRVSPQEPAAGWPQAAQPRVTDVRSSGRGIRVSVRCRGIPGLYCVGSLALVLRLGHRTLKVVRRLVIAAAGQGADLDLGLPQGLSSVGHGRVDATASFAVKDFLGRRGYAQIRRNVRIG